jgi:hypothetical protein
LSPEDHENHEDLTFEPGLPLDPLTQVMLVRLLSLKCTSHASEVLLLKEFRKQDSKMVDLSVYRV